MEGGTEEEMKEEIEEEIEKEMEGGMEEEIKRCREKWRIRTKRMIDCLSHFAKIERS